MSDYGLTITVQKNDCPWKVAARNLKAQGAKVSNAAIIEEMNRLAKLNNCESVDDFSKKFFYSLGMEIKTKEDEPQSEVENEEVENEEVANEEVENNDKTPEEKETDDKKVTTTDKNNVKVGDNNGTTVIIIGDDNTVIIGGQKPNKPPQKDDDIENPPNENPEEPQEWGDSFANKGCAKDIELLKKYGVDPNSNDKNARAQFVDSTYTKAIGGTWDKPDEIQMYDDTNKGESCVKTDPTTGKKYLDPKATNVYRYRKITPEDIEKGEINGIKIDKSQFKEGETYYVLVDTTNNNIPEAIHRTDHLEIYRLDAKQIEAGSFSYELIQEKGMQGSSQSSIDYRKRF